MNIVIRTDASIEIGTGHVMRCLTLAKQLKRHGAEVTFVCREFEGNSISYILDQGMSVCSLPAIDTKESDVRLTKDCWKIDADETISVIKKLDDEVDLLIVDHYGLDSRWENSVRYSTKTIMVIDDLADRKHNCDIILDATFGVSEEKYSNLIPSQTKGLYGVKYSLLREQFKENQKDYFSYNNHCIKVHVFFGGIDSESHTTQYSELILDHFPNIEIMAVVGSAFQFVEDLKRLQKKYEKRFHWEMEVKNMAIHMKQCDIAFGAPGTATWERACVGLPSAYLSVNKNQVPILVELEGKELCVFLGEASTVSEQAFLSKFGNFIESPNLLYKFFLNGTKHVDGKGTERIVKVLRELN